LGLVRFGEASIISVIASIITSKASIQVPTLIVTRGLMDEVIVNIRAIVETWSSILDPEWSSRS